MAPNHDARLRCYLCNRLIPSGEAVVPRSGYGAITMHLMCYERALGAETKAKSTGLPGRRAVRSRRKKNRGA